LFLLAFDICSKEIWSFS